jgi:hypothetical protein
MKIYVGVKIQSHILLTLALVGGEWSTFRPGHITIGEIALDTHLIGGWVCPRSGLDNMEKKKILTLLGLELRPSVKRPGREHSWPISVAIGNLKMSIMRMLCRDLNHTSPDYKSQVLQREPTLSLFKSLLWLYH